jgi:hypothetical protein
VTAVSALAVRLAVQGVPVSSITFDRRIKNFVCCAALLNANKRGHGGLSALGGVLSACSTAVSCDRRTRAQTKAFRDSIGLWR